MRNHFVYYYFLYRRRHGLLPKEAAFRAIEWVKWWGAFKDGRATSPSPLVRGL